MSKTRTNQQYNSLEEWRATKELPSPKVYRSSPYKKWMHSQLTYDEILRERKLRSMYV